MSHVHALCGCGKPTEENDGALHALTADLILRSHQRPPDRPLQHESRKARPCRPYARPEPPCCTCECCVASRSCATSAHFRSYISHLGSSARSSARHSSHVRAHWRRAAHVAPMLPSRAVSRTVPVPLLVYRCPQSARIPACVQVPVPVPTPCARVR